MPKFAELTRKERLQYFREIKEGLRLPSENIYLSGIVITHGDHQAEMERISNDPDFKKSMHGNKGSAIFLPSNGREILAEEYKNSIL